MWKPVTRRAKAPERWPAWTSIATGEEPGRRRASRRYGIETTPDRRSSARAAGNILAAHAEQPRFMAAPSCAMTGVPGRTASERPRGNYRSREPPSPQKPLHTGRNADALQTCPLDNPPLTRRLLWLTHPARARPRAISAADGCDSGLREHLLQATARAAVAHFGLIVGG